MSKQIKENERQLLNTGDVLVFAFGAMIGWGWVVLSGQWIVTGGIIGTAIGFLIGGLMIYFVGLCYSGIKYKSTVCESAKDIVLFDKTYAHPVGDIKDFII